MSRRVLLVEDDLETRLFFRIALTVAGFEVQEAGNGLTALRMIDGSPPDAIVLDLGLPVLDGYVVRSEIAAQAHTQLIPIIIVTGRPGDHERLDVACVLRKPVSDVALVSAVERSLQASGGPVAGV